MFNDTNLALNICIGNNKMQRAMLTAEYVSGGHNVMLQSTFINMNKQNYRLRMVSNNIFTDLSL